MCELLLSYGADRNAPAYARSGRTALQAALEVHRSFEIARILLDKGADVFAPPALLDGVTTLEAVCLMGRHERIHEEEKEEAISLCNRLLDLGAPVNRPNGVPSLALHGVIMRGWDEIVLRMLELQLYGREGLHLG